MRKLTIDELGEMPAEDKTLHFDQLATELWPDSTNKADTICQHLGVTRPTYFGWRRQHRVPATIIMLMQEWANVYDDDKEQQAWTNLAADLSQVTQTLANLTYQISQLAQRLEHLAEHRVAAQVQIVADELPLDHESRISYGE